MKFNLVNNENYAIVHNSIELRIEVKPNTSEFQYLYDCYINKTKTGDNILSDLGIVIGLYVIRFYLVNTYKKTTLTLNGGGFVTGLETTTKNIFGIEPKAYFDLSNQLEPESYSLD